MCYVFLTREKADRAKARIAKHAPELLCQVARAVACGNENAARLIAAQTLTARANGTLIAKKAEIDLLLRLAGTSQILEAIRKAGCRNNDRTLLIAAGSDRSVRKLLAMRDIGGRRLRSGPLTTKEKMMIENAAVLSALRA